MLTGVVWLCLKNSFKKAFEIQRFCYGFDTLSLIKDDSEVCYKVWFWRYCLDDIPSHPVQVVRWIQIVAFMLEKKFRNIGDKVFHFSKNQKSRHFLALGQKVVELSWVVFFFEIRRYFSKIAGKTAVNLLRTADAPLL